MILVRISTSTGTRTVRPTYTNQPFTERYTKDGYVARRVQFCSPSQASLSIPSVPVTPFACPYFFLLYVKRESGTWKKKKENKTKNENT